MKKYLIIAFAAALMFGGTAVYAEETTTTVDVAADVTITTDDSRPLYKPGIRKDMMEKRVELRKDAVMQKESLLDRRESLETRFEGMTNLSKEKRDMLIKKFDEQTEKMRMQFHEQYAKRAIRGIAQIENLTVRFETRIAKFKADGIDTTKADAELAVVKTDLATATAKFEALKGLYPQNGEEWTEAMKEAAKTAKTEAETAVRKVHESLKKLLATLKSYNSVNASASTSTQTTVQ